MIIPTVKPMFTLIPTTHTTIVPTETPTPTPTIIFTDDLSPSAITIITASTVGIFSLIVISIVFTIYLLLLKPRAEEQTRSIYQEL
jgi:hypothetical protein